MGFFRKMNSFRRVSRYAGRLVVKCEVCNGLILDTDEYYGGDPWTAPLKERRVRCIPCFEEVGDRDMAKSYKYSLIGNSIARDWARLRRAVDATIYCYKCKLDIRANGEYYRHHSSDRVCPSCYASLHVYDLSSRNCSCGVRSPSGEHNHRFDKSYPEYPAVGCDCGDWHAVKNSYTTPAAKDTTELTLQGLAATAQAFSEAMGTGADQMATFREEYKKAITKSYAKKLEAEFLVGVGLNEMVIEEKPLTILPLPSGPTPYTAVKIEAYEPEAPTAPIEPDGPRPLRKVRKMKRGA